mgnify:CR=1 FL=1
MFVQNSNICLYKSHKKGVERMSPRTGRPTENPKNIRIGIRLTQDEKEMLDECEKKLNLTKTQIISLGIQKVYESIKK